jgi:hypothetical protein
MCPGPSSIVYKDSVRYRDWVDRQMRKVPRQAKDVMMIGRISTQYAV